MRLLLLISSILVFTVCSGQKSVSSKSKTINYGQVKDTLVVNKQRIVRTLRDEKLQSLVMFSGDTILKDAGYYSNIEFIDINADGYKDIRAFVVSNTPNQCENYLFDIGKRVFRLLQNCDLDITLIKGTSYFYSYNRAGCADMNWESYLSRIENFKLVPAGYIYGQGCDFDIEKNPQTIEIYKVTNPATEAKVLLKKLPYVKYIPKSDSKWNFIQNYWRNNWQTFKS